MKSTTKIKTNSSRHYDGLDTIFTNVYRAMSKEDIKKAKPKSRLESFLRRRALETK